MECRACTDDKENKKVDKYVPITQHADVYFMAPKTKAALCGEFPTKYLCAEGSSSRHYYSHSGWLVYVRAACVLTYGSPSGEHTGVKGGRYVAV